MKQITDLSRFVEAHQHSYKTALLEIQKGRKTSHWMWYIFPQLYGLGHSSTAKYYAITDMDEALAFIRDPYLGKNLVEISNALLKLDTNNPTEIFGKPDDRKLKSCMTLFSLVTEEETVFNKVLEKYFDGKPDRRTLNILGIQ